MFCGAVDAKQVKQPKLKGGTGDHLSGAKSAEQGGGRTASQDDPSPRANSNVKGSEITIKQKNSNVKEK